MTRPGLSTHALAVETTEGGDPAELVPLLDRTDPIAFLQGSDGFIGIGTAVRLEFSGPHRMTDAAAAWRELTAAARVSDPIARPGTGLIAFGSFAFSDASAEPSVLIVPSLVVGRREGRSWITRIDGGGSAAVRPSPIVHRPVALDPGRMTPDAYLAAVAAAIGRIRDGALDKAVLARDLTGRLPAGFDPRALVDRLAAAYPECWTYAVDGLIGSSPETLVRVHRGTVTARVLAGSAGRGRDDAGDLAASDDLEHSAKNLDEHDYAVQSVLAALREHSDDIAVSRQPFPLRLPNLWHLATDVSGSLHDDSTSLDLIAALHPTAAVAGTPTDAALGLIAELEPFDRGRYAGPVGWVGADGDGEWAIALRGAALADGVITALAGGGIVRDSDPASELAETTMKFRAVTEALA